MLVIPGLAVSLPRLGKVSASIEDVGVAVRFLLVEEPEARGFTAVLSVRSDEELPGLDVEVAGVELLEPMDFNGAQIC